MNTYDDTRGEKFKPSDREIPQKLAERNIHKLSEISLKPLPFLSLLAILLPALFLIWIVNGICILGAVLLLFLHDIHGAALLTGMGVGVVLAWIDPLYRPQ